MMTRLLQLVVITVALAMPVAVRADASRRFESTLPESTDSAPTQPSFQPSGTRPTLGDGWEAYERGEIGLAVRIYRDATTRLPDDALLWYDLGCLYALNHEFEESRRALRHALYLNSHLALGHDALGQIYEQLGEVAIAEALYTTAMLLEPATVKFLRHRVRALLRMNAPQAARHVMRELLLLEPSDLESRYQLGVLELRANAPDLALMEFQKVLAQTPDHVMALNGLALASIRIGRLEEATKVLERAKGLDPTNATTQSNLGLIAAAQQRWLDARSAWQRALELEPHFAPAEQNLEALNAMLASPTP